MRRVGFALGLGILAALAGSANAAATTLEPIGSATYSSPTYVTSDPRDPDRLFVTEQPGTIDVTTPAGTSLFLDLTDKVIDPGGSERGLWSMAFAPDFAQSGLFYVAYAANGAGALTLDEYHEEPTPDATEATRRPVLSLDSPANTNHNGGQLQFGPDGYLYWSTGEDAVAANSQSLANPLGKLLRIDPRPNGGGAYAIPSDNPFVAVAGARGEIWALGLRNPWRFSFDRATGALAVGDVGEVSWEEVDYATQASGGGRGANYGWPNCEALVGGGCSAPFTAPLHAYRRNGGDCAVMGGYVVRDPDLGDLVGRYLFSDLCGGDLRSIDPLAPPPFDSYREEGLEVSNPVSFGEDACGRLYVVAQGNGRVFRIEGPSGGACGGSGADVDPPQTELELRRKGPRSTKATFLISSDEPGSSFRCRFDKGKWKACGERRKLKRLDRRSHKFRAVATDPAGNVDPKPAKRQFTVKRRRR